MQKKKWQSRFLKQEQLNGLSCQKKQINSWMQLWDTSYDVNGSKYLSHTDVSLELIMTLKVYTVGWDCR